MDKLYTTQTVTDSITLLLVAKIQEILSSVDNTDVTKPLANASILLLCVTVPVINLALTDQDVLLMFATLNSINVTELSSTVSVSSPTEIAKKVKHTLLTCLQESMSTMEMHQLTTTTLLLTEMAFQALLPMSPELVDNLHVTTECLLNILAFLLLRELTLANVVLTTAAETDALTTSAEVLEHGQTDKWTPIVTPLIFLNVQIVTLVPLISVMFLGCHLFLFPNVASIKWSMQRPTVTTETFAQKTTVIQEILPVILANTDSILNLT